MTQQLLPVAAVPEGHNGGWLPAYLALVNKYVRVRLGNTRHIVSTYLYEPFKLNGACARAAPHVAQCDTGEDLGRNLDDEHFKGKVVMLGPEHRKLAHGATTRSMRVGSLPVLTIFTSSSLMLALRFLADRL